MRDIYYCPANTEDIKFEILKRLEAFGGVKIATNNSSINNGIIESLDRHNDDVVIISLGHDGQGAKRTSVGRGVYSSVAHAERLRLPVYLVIVKDSRLWFKQADLSSLTGKQDHRNWGYINLSPVFLSSREVFNEVEKYTRSAELDDVVDPVTSLRKQLKIKTPNPTLSPGVCVYFKQSVSS